MSNGKLLKIDEMVIDDHYYLTLDEKCFYFVNYTSGVGYNNNPVNSLILNFKKKPNRKGCDDWKYKIEAIEDISEHLKENVLSKIDLTQVTLVPIPPSKAKNHELYYDRMTQTLIKACEGFNSDIRELIFLNESMKSVHEGNRRSPDELENLMRIDSTQITGVKNDILLFDDLLTTGSHFMACKNLILKQFPNSNVYGVFIARRALEKEGSLI